MIQELRTVGVYTTVYPAVLKYMKDWMGSVLAQSDHDFSLWIGLDSATESEVQQAAGADINAHWIAAKAGESPADIRLRGLVAMMDRCDAVILVDSDDILHSSRVEAARHQLMRHDLAGCALRLVDESGHDMNTTFNIPGTLTPDELFPRSNAFGFSNSAYRTSLLKKCLPFPGDTVLVDWHLATKAWLYRARIDFDRTMRMDYRQYGDNMTQVRPPFSAAQIARDAYRVQHHFRLLGGPMGPVDPDPARWKELERVRADIESFINNIVGDAGRLEEYARAVNSLDLAPLWWSSIAHPSLNRMWQH